MNLAGLSIAAGLAVMFLLALPFSLVLLIPAVWIWCTRMK